MKNKKLIKRIILFSVMLGIVIFFVFSFERIKTSIIIFFSKSPSRTCSTVECAKEKGTFLWEYEVPVKEVFYEDSIRKIHFKMENAFAEKKWALNVDYPNYAYIYEEYTRIVVPCEYFNLPKNRFVPDGQKIIWRISSNCSAHPKHLTFHYQDYKLPPDSLTAHIIAINKDEDLKPLKGNGDTLVSFSLYRKFE
ncbi:hypothetical protein LJC11_05400 [Bacteroidales bacterium OttesenSCG-928-I21]|nr:hypothetical protein [Bacteroidales bacterium OttesenSCG-928-I21]